jgi:hypothetical protein
MGQTAEYLKITALENVARALTGCFKSLLESENESGHEHRFQSLNFLKSMRKVQLRIERSRAAKNLSAISVG